MHTDNVTNIDDLRSTVEQTGFGVIPSCLEDVAVTQLQDEFSAEKYPQRNLLMQPIIQNLARSSAVRQVTEAVLGANCFAVRGIFFNKTERDKENLIANNAIPDQITERPYIPILL